MAMTRKNSRWLRSTYHWPSRAFISLIRLLRSEELRQAFGQTFNAPVPWRVSLSRLQQKYCVQDTGDQQPLEQVVDRPVPGLDARAEDADLEDVLEDAVEHADVLARHILRRGSLDHGAADGAVDCANDRVRQRPLDVAEQDDAGDVSAVLGSVDVGLVEHDGLAVLP